MIPRKLLDEINRWISEKKYGNLQINFSGGKILNVNRYESIKVEMLASGTESSASATLSSSIPID